MEAQGYSASNAVMHVIKIREGILFVVCPGLPHNHVRRWLSKGSSFKKLVKVRKCTSTCVLLLEFMCFYQPGALCAREPPGPKIALHFSRCLSVCLFVCASTLITCAILHHALLCNCSLLLFLEVCRPRYSKRVA